MNLPKFLIAFLIFIACSESVQSQDTLLLSSYPVNSVISYDPKGLPQHAFNNTIIREIAEDAVKSLKKTRLVINTDLKCYLLRKENLTWLKVSTDSIQVSGDHYYRKMSVSDVLKPSYLSLTLQLRSVQDSLIINEFTDLNLSIKKNDSIILSVTDGESYKNSAWLSAGGISFHFGEDDLNAFHHRQRLIDDYYASAAISDSLEPVMRSMDFRKKELYPEYFIQIGEIGKIEQLIRSRDFDYILNLEQHDPRGLSMKCYYLLRYSRSAAMTFEQSLDTIPVLNSRLSEDSLIIKYIDLIKRYIRWSFLINERNSGIYREFLDRFFEMNAFDDDLRILKKLIGRVYPIISADSIFRELLYTLKSTYHKEAESLTEHARYAEAISLLDHARKLEDSFPFLKDTLTDAGAREKAALGIYLSYIGVAENSLNLGKNSIARFYIEKAYHYASSNPGMIQSDSAYQNVLSRYHQSSLISCDALINSGDFEKALECYRELAQEMDSATDLPLRKELDHRISIAREGMVQNLIIDAKRYIDAGQPDSTMIVYDQAVSLQENIHESTGTAASIDSLKPVTDRYRYNDLIFKIEEYQKKREFTSAYNAHIQAKEIAVQQNLPDGPLLDSIYRMIYPKYLEEQLARARPLIWSNQFLKAQAFLDSVQELTAEKGFEEDPGLRSALDSYGRKIKERVCWNAEEKIRILVIRAQRNLMSLNYIKAISLLDSSLIIRQTHPDCDLETDSIRHLIRNYQPAKQYQEMLIKTDGNISLGMYDGFVPGYNETGQFYKNNSLEQFGLIWIPVYDYVKAKSRETLTYSVCRYYMDLNNFTEAFKYLKLLREQGFSAKDARNVLLSAGKQMAILDYQFHNDKDPEEILRNYTGGDEWFTIFVKAYFKEWKKCREQ